MSDTSEASQDARPQSGVGTIVRLLAIALGIMSAILLARDGFQVTLNQYLDAVAVAYDDMLKDVVLIVFEPAILTVLAKLREMFGIDLHLYPHWKHVFVLLWLYLGAVARDGNRAEPERRQTWLDWAWDWIGGSAIALIGAALAGLSQVSGAGVFWWPFASIVFFRFGPKIWHLANSWGMEFIHAFTLPILLGILALLSLAGGYLLLDTQAPGLAALTVLILLFGLSGLAPGDEPAQRAQAVRFSLSILSVLGGATFIAWVGHALA